MTLETVEQMRYREKGRFLLLIGIILFASNLRAPLTAVGSLIPEIRETLGVSNAVVGSITTLPLLAFAFISPFAPKIADRLGIEKTIFLSMIMLAIGIMMRSITGVGTLFLGTVLIGVAIAFGNVLLPGFIKMSFPFKIGLMTGLYAVFMNILGALGSGLSVPISNIGSFGWQGALGAWVILVLITICVWIPQVKHPAPLPKYDVDNNKHQSTIWTSFTAWQVTIFMGLQSLMYYTALTWLPDILKVNGYSSSEAGWLLSLMLFAAIPLTFVIPVVADKLANQKILGFATGAMFMIGVLGLFSSNLVIIIMAAILFGVGCGSGFSLSMMFFSLRTKNGQDAAKLSGMAQSVGYLLAALGPVLAGGVHDLTDSWTAPLFMMIILAAVILVAGTLAGRKLTI
ncbi:MFS transporter [Pseudogracilibacillus sp. SE30717A]|uniref:CynX/NimT family MFS transporter n=1 Tax=Pseudogracilibacillus sp. SE30717A TaxID=3098293 RepID=UPI00300E0863